MSFWLFLYGNITFLATLFLLIFLLAKPFKKKENFRHKVLFLPLLLLPAVCISLLYYHAACQVQLGGVAFQVVSTVNYLLLFAVVIAALVLLYDEDFWQILLTAVAAYASQHFISNCFLIIRVAFKLDQLLYDGKFTTFFGLQLVVTGALIGVFYCTFIRESNRNFARGGYSKEVLCTCVLGLLLVLALNLLRDVYSSESKAMNIICACFSLFSCFFVLLLYSGIVAKNQLTQERETMRELWNKDKKQYELSRDSIEMINMKCHDFRKRFELMEEQGFQNSKELEELKNSIEIYDAGLKTGNAAVDTILMEYRIFCERHNIRFTVVADCRRLDFMSEEDIYSMFSNLISNAIEGVQSLEEKGKKVISLVVREQAGVLCVKLENYFDGNIVLKNGLPVTTKADVESHGFGTKSIKLICEKYDGTMNFHIDEDIISVQAIFPIP